MGIRKIVTACFFVFAAYTIHAQSYNIVNFGVKEGVLHSLVTDITQDQRGDIWLTTGGGLCRYNGVDFSYLTTRNGLNSTRLTCISTDDEDNLWVGSSIGLNFIQGDKILSVTDSLLRNEIISITSAGKSSVWVIASNGLFLVNFINNSFTINEIDISTGYNSDESQIFQDRSVNSFILPTIENSIYFGNNGKLFEIINNKPVRVRTSENIQVNAGIQLESGDILFGTNKGVYIRKGNTIEPLKGLPTTNIFVKDIAFDGNKLWVLGYDKSLKKVESKLFSFDFNNPSFLRIIGKLNGLTADPTKIFVDHERSLWATSNNGVNLVKASPFEAYTSDNGLVGNKIWGISIAKDGSLWVGTIGEGLSIIKNNNYYNYSKANGLPDNYVGKIFQNRKGKILIGTGNEGICIVENTPKYSSLKFKRINLMLGSNLRVDDIAEDINGTTWIATSKGLYFTHNLENFIHFPLNTSDTGQVFVQKILFDTASNTMWIGTRYNGVYTIRNNVVKPFSIINQKEEVTSLLTDHYKNIWIGTRANGVYRFNGNTLSHFTEKEGLTSNLIYILHVDRNNSLWVGTNLGLNRIDLDALVLKDSLIISYYDSNKGLIDLEMNLNGVYQENDWSFWIATNGGLLKYDLRSDNENSIAPKVRLSKIKLNSLDTDWSKYSSTTDAWNGIPSNLELEHYQNHLTFEFIGISFKNPKLVTYKWKLDGFDEKWITSNSRQAIYSNIPPGMYTFRVKAANSDMVWSDEVSSMPIKIKRPFWETWWFRILIIFIILTIIYLYILIRIKSLKTKQKELKNIVDIRTHELRHQLMIVDEQNRKIFDSLEYAKFLQNSMLSPIDELSQNFSDVLIYYKPKDIVSGDFYWYSRYNDISVIAVADCTGHGVPGAIISIICENALRQAVTECKFCDPAEILTRTNRYVIEKFAKTHREIHHGMEIALCTFNHETRQLTFSGAMLGIHILKNSEIIKIKPSIYRIGWDLSTPTFTNEIFSLEKGDILYLFTDGFYDQFEPVNRKKFSLKRLKEILIQGKKMEFKEMHNTLNNEFNSWKGDYEQIDDVLVVGIKI